MRWILGVLLLVVAFLQYRLWWGEGGRLELTRLQEQLADARLANDRLRKRNEHLARQVVDLKEGQTVLEQRAREELGLTKADEVFYHIVESDDVDRLQQTEMRRPQLSSDSKPRLTDSAQAKSDAGKPSSPGVTPPEDQSRPSDKDVER
ncbi:MAG: cell division protein FtsB [Pseudomonadota bacterium]